MRRSLLALTALAIGIVACLGAISPFLVNWLWFNTLGFGSVFSTVWHTEAAVFLIAAAASGAIIAFNGLLAERASLRNFRRPRVFGASRARIEASPEILEYLPDHFPWRAGVLGAAIFLGLVIGLAQANRWDLILKWLYAVSFNQTDPLFDHDLGFYLFRLPAYELARDWGVTVISLTMVLTACVYWLRGAIDWRGAVPSASVPAIRHLSALLACFFLIKSGDYLLQRYDLLLNSNGVVFGAAYTDVHVELPLLATQVVVAVLAAALCTANVFSPGFRLPVAAVALLFAVSLMRAAVVTVFQSYWVKPDELRLESPYIVDNIALTRYGFGLDRISRRPFPAQGRLAPETLASDNATIQNIRWWDPRPLLDTYRQLQELRLYYDFRDIDVDRYTIDGSYRQVMLSARELNQSRLPADAQTWINERFKYTHGIGLAMNPVNRFDGEGLPIFYIKDIPPAAPPELRVDRPEIYFGEETSNYVVVRGATREFDYAKGQENVYNTYEGTDGVSLGALWRRLLFAWHFGDLKLLISDNITGSSRILFRRLIQDRIHRIAPFLLLDHDPYLVVSGGRLIWLQDAYTTSNMLPYSQQNGPSGINYIRNSVKVAVDAYDGKPVFYVADPKDPILRVYQRIFPSLLRPLSAMSSSLRQHIRYPEDLFGLQARMYGIYHMTDPEVFYNKEDLWSFPGENYAGQNITMQPYYIIMRLPGEAREEFILMLPMVPSTRDNMIAWLAARCDGPNYGNVIEFAFPKEKLIYGPAQIEARIDQDTAISQQLSLWNQIGSRVIRGNLLVIPIHDALLYVEPLYLSAEQRQVPEVKRLIASYGDRVVMRAKVDSLLVSLFKPQGAQPLPVENPSIGKAPGEAAKQAAQHYRRALQALQKGDWKEFGAEMDSLQKALKSPATSAGP